jgi:hypothetical protein
MDILWEVSMGQSSRKPLSVGGDAEELAQEIAGLLPLDAAALRQKWAALFGADPSPYLGRLLLIRAIAHRRQEKAFPGLKPFAQRALVACNSDIGTAPIYHEACLQESFA